MNIAPRISVKNASIKYGITQKIIFKFIKMGWIAREKYGISRQSHILIRVTELERVLHCMQIGKQPPLVPNSLVTVDWNAKIQSIKYE